MRPGQVMLEIPNGPTSVPPMLHAREDALEVGIRFHGFPELPGEGETRAMLTDFFRPHGVGWPPAG
ncbi:MAG TPA: hypothetical protein VHQ42_07090 [Candidatus Limnocylindria bacterium]|nr:hypothetical protein [Candidatus Limnocylindria bacterium]